MRVENYIKASIETKESILHDSKILKIIDEVADIIVQAYKDGKKVLIAGNGGSAADAQHIAGELVSKFYFDREPLSAISLSTDTSVLTAIGNDYGYENVFARQVRAIGVKGDVFLAISTSGNSKNVVLALEEARKIGLATVGLMGEKACVMDNLCDYSIKVPSHVTPHIQESHIMVGHIICALVEERIFGENK